VSARAQAATFRFIVGNTIAGEPADGQLILLPKAPQATVPVIATKAFMDGNDLAVGDVTSVTMNGPQVPVRIVAEVPSFPAVSAPGGAVIADLASLQESFARQLMSPMAVSQWWLATTGGGVPTGLAAGLPSGTAVTTVAQRGAAAAADERW